MNWRQTLSRRPPKAFLTRDKTGQSDFNCERRRVNRAFRRAELDALELPPHE
jgi:hypothetical protein